MVYGWSLTTLARHCTSEHGPMLLYTDASRRPCDVWPRKRKILKIVRCPGDYQICQWCADRWSHTMSGLFLTIRYAGDFYMYGDDLWQGILHVWWWFVAGHTTCMVVICARAYYMYDDDLCQGILHVWWWFAAGHTTCMVMICVRACFMERCSTGSRRPGSMRQTRRVARSSVPGQLVPDRPEPGRSSLDRSSHFLHLALLIRMYARHMGE